LPGQSRPDGRTDRLPDGGMLRRASRALHRVGRHRFTADPDPGGYPGGDFRQALNRPGRDWSCPPYLPNFLATETNVHSTTMGTFERYLTIWVLACIVAGIVLGELAPGLFQAVAALEVARVNLPIAVLIWLMIIPMLLKVDLEAIGNVRTHWRGVGVTLFVNWGVKPFSMALLAWFFIGWLFRPLLPAEQIESYIAGLIILAAAPCTAMVFVWSHLTRGEPNYTLSQVALNDAIMIVAFAPVVGLLLGLSAITVPWDTLFLSVVLYIVVPLILANLWRRWLLDHEHGVLRLQRVLDVMHPVSLAALLATLVLLFGFQGEQIIAQPLVIALLAVPILIQVFFNSGL